MQCVIFAAGRATRMGSLVDNTPKPLLEVEVSLHEKRPILDLIGDALPDAIDQVILVTGYLAEQIEERYHDGFCGRPVHFCRQANIKGGTADALLCTRRLIRDESFLIMNGDDLHGADALARAVEHPAALVAAWVDDTSSFGRVVTDGQSRFIRIDEKCGERTPGLVNTGAMVVPPSIFDYEPTVQPNGERYLPEMLSMMAADQYIQVVTQNLWIPVGTPDQLRDASWKLCDGGLRFQQYLKAA